MAVPAVPSIGSRAIYVPYSVPAAVRTVSSQAPNNVQFVSSGIPGDIGNAGTPLPAVIASVSGAAPDYAGTVFLVHTPSGQIVPRYSGFASGQPLLSQATWTSQGSNPAQAYWYLSDALS